MPVLRTVGELLSICRSSERGVEMAYRFYEARLASWSVSDAVTEELPTQQE